MANDSFQSKNRSRYNNNSFQVCKLVVLLLWCCVVVVLINLRFFRKTIIIGLAICRWKLPPQQGDIIYSDCKSITDVLKSSAPSLSKHPAKLPFLQAVLHHLKALHPQGVTHDWTNPILNDDPRRHNTLSTTRAYSSRTVQHPTTQSQAKSGSNNIFSSRSQFYSRPPLTRAHGSSASLWHTTNVLSNHPQTGHDHVHISGQQT